MSLLADDHVHRGRPDEAVLLDVPARALEHGVAARSQAGEVRHLPAGDEADAGRRRQGEEVEEPPGGDLFDHGRGRPAGVEAGILVPRRRQPVGGEGGGQAAANDEAEVARARAGDEAGLGRRRQMLDDGPRLAPPRGQRPAEGAPERGQVRPRPHGTVGKRVQELAGEIGDPAEQRGVAHSTSQQCINTIVRYVLISPARYT